MNAQVTHRSGTLSGDVLNRPGDFRMRINSALNPTDLMPLCPPKFQHALTDWEFQTSPVIQATFSGATPEFAKIAGAGQIWLGKTKFRGALLNSASANFELRNNVVRCDQVRVIRDEGIGTGRFTFDLGQDQLNDRRCRNESFSWRGGSLDRSVDRKNSAAVPLYRYSQRFMPPEWSNSEVDPATIFESGSMRGIRSPINLTDGKFLSSRDPGIFPCLEEIPRISPSSGTISVQGSQCERVESLCAFADAS